MLTFDAPKTVGSAISRVVLLPLIILILSACGSGGDSGTNTQSDGTVATPNNTDSSAPTTPIEPTSSPSTPTNTPTETTDQAPFSLTFTQSDFRLQAASLTGDENQSAPPTVDLIGKVTGELPAENIAFVVGVSEDIFLEGTSTTTFTNNIFKFAISPRTDLWPGNYNGVFLIDVCESFECNERFGDSPYLITYDLTYTPESMYIRPLEDQGLTNLTDFDGRFSSIERDFIFEMTTVEGAPKTALQFDYVFPDNATDIIFPEALYANLDLQLIDGNVLSLSLPENTRGLYNYSYDVLHSINGKQKTTTMSINHTVLPAGVEINNASILASDTSLSLLVGTANNTELSIPVFVPTGAQRLTASPECDWLSEGFFSGNDAKGFFDYTFTIDNKERSTFGPRDISLSQELAPGQYSCVITFNYNSAEVGQFTVNLTISEGYALTIPEFVFSQFQTAAQPQTFSVLSSSPATEQVRWTLSGLPDWLVVDPKWLTPGQSAKSFEASVRLTPELINPAQAGIPLNGFITIEDESKILRDILLSVSVYALPVGLQSVTPTAVNAGEAFTLTVAKDSLTPTDVSLLRIQKKNQPDGLQGIEDVAITLASGDPQEIGPAQFDLNIGALNEPGTYELFSLTPTEESSNLTIWFSERIEFEVFESAAANQSTSVQPQEMTIHLKHLNERNKN